MFFRESDIMAHKAMTGHHQFEKRNSRDKGEEARQELLGELDAFGIPIKALDPLPNGALQELLDALKKAKAEMEKGRK